MGTKIPQQNEKGKWDVLDLQRSHSLSPNSSKILSSILEEPLTYYNVVRELQTAYVGSLHFDSSQDGDLLYCSEMLRSFCLDVYLHQGNSNQQSALQLSNKASALLQNLKTDSFRFYSILKDLITAFPSSSLYDTEVDLDIVFCGEIWRSFFLEILMSGNMNHKSTALWESDQMRA